MQWDIGYIVAIESNKQEISKNWDQKENRVHCPRLIVGISRAKLKEED